MMVDCGYFFVDRSIQHGRKKPILTDLVSRRTIQFV